VQIDPQTGLPIPQPSPVGPQPVQIDPKTGLPIPQTAPLGPQPAQSREPEETVEVLTSDPRLG